MTTVQSIGKKITLARKKNQLSQAGLAKLIAISPQAVGKWERDESIPDIITLNRLAEILGVDLNYFSDKLPAPEIEHSDHQHTLSEHTIPAFKQKKKFSWNWNMSSGNWVDADFSGLKNLQEKFSSSNMKNCKFHHADLSGLILSGNNIEKCEFHSADIRNSKIQASNLLNNQYQQCSFIDASFIKNNISKCDFTEANFSGTEFLGGCFEKNSMTNAVWKFTAFKGMAIGDVVFEGVMEDCHFENNAFYNVTFQNVTFLNTFFKYNRRFKKVQFVQCTADKLSYAFLKNNQANVNGIQLL